jgi:hypothetical protein
VGISAQFVKFRHLGTEYIVDRKYVIDIEERLDPSAAGGAATLTLNRDAALLANYSISAIDLASALPFSLSRVPAVPYRRIAPSPREIAWRRNTGYSDYPSLEIYLSQFSTVTACDSFSAGILDDTLADDERADT